MTNKLYKFQHINLIEDEVDDKGKVKAYAVVFVVAGSEKQAREKLGRDEEMYRLNEVKLLGDGWL